MTVRLATIEDILPIAEMELEYVQEKVGDDFTLQQALTYILTEVSKPTCKILLADDYQGFSLTYITKIRWYGPLVMVLDHTYIRPEYRSIKTQNECLDAVKVLATDMGCTKIATLWHPIDEVERVDKAMQRKGWARSGAYYEINLGEQQCQ